MISARPVAPSAAQTGNASCAASTASVGLALAPARDLRERLCVDRAQVDEGRVARDALAADEVLGGDLDAGDLDAVQAETRPKVDRRDVDGRVAAVHGEDRAVDV